MREAIPGLGSVQIPILRSFVIPLLLAAATGVHKTPRVNSSIVTILSLLALTLCTWGAQCAAPANNWPQFRGPGALGVADHPNLPDCWSTNENVAWKIEVPGRGWSAPIVWGDKVFVTAVTSEGEMESPKKGLYFGGERKEIPQVAHRWLVLSYDLKSGRELWRQEAHRGTPANRLHVKNTYASETPAT